MPPILPATTKTAILVFRRCNTRIQTVICCPLGGEKSAKVLNLLTPQDLASRKAKFGMIENASARG